VTQAISAILEQLLGATLINCVQPVITVPQVLYSQFHVPQRFTGQALEQKMFQLANLVKLATIVWTTIMFLEYAHVVISALRKQRNQSPALLELTTLIKDKEQRLCAYHAQLGQLV